MADQAKRLGMGILGLGGFGHYALQQFVQVPGVEVVGMASTSNAQARSAIERFGAREFDSIDALLAEPGLDLVYIATPPFLHFQQAMAALAAGKHVICEKPLAMTVAQGEQMLAEAERRGLMLVTNLMQRYNPIFGLVDRICKLELLGKPLHGIFENYASDENLGPDHWFWDRAKSGGIFVEHSVHFFDVFAAWLGQGKVVAAQSMARPGSGLEEAVNCTAIYQDTVPVNFYHGFTQPGRLDRQLWRILFEHGDLTLHEWVPTKLEINALLDEAGTRRLTELLPGARLHAASFGHQTMRSRHKEWDAYQQVQITYENPGGKAFVYSDLLFNMMTDQKAYLDDRSHVRVITEMNGLESLKMAEAARLMTGVA